MHAHIHTHTYTYNNIHTYICTILNSWVPPLKKDAHTHIRDMRSSSDSDSDSDSTYAETMTEMGNWTPNVSSWVKGLHAFHTSEMKDFLASAASPLLSSPLPPNGVATATTTANAATTDISSSLPLDVSFTEAVQQALRANDTSFRWANLYTSGAVVDR